jgi:uncharacterized protein (UPF0335 family)
MKPLDVAHGFADGAPSDSNLDGGYGADERAETLQLFAERLLAEAEKAIGLVSPHDGLRDELAYLLWKTLRNRTAGAASPKAIFDRVKRLEYAAAALASELSELLQQSAGDQVVADQVLFLLGVLKPAGRWDISSIERLAEDSRSLADSTSSVVIASNGRPPDDERYVVASRLDEIVSTFTGVRSKYTYRHDTEEYSGPLFLLMRAFMDAEALASGAIAPLNATVAQCLRRAFPKKRQATKTPQK